MSRNKRKRPPFVYRGGSMRGYDLLCLAGMYDFTITPADEHHVQLDVRSLSDLELAGLLQTLRCVLDSLDNDPTMRAIVERMYPDVKDLEKGVPPQTVHATFVGPPLFVTWSVHQWLKRHLPRRVWRKLSEARRDRFGRIVLLEGARLTFVPGVEVMLHASAAGFHPFKTVKLVNRPSAA